MEKPIARMKNWSRSLTDDVALVKELVGTAAAPYEARLLAAGALNYLVIQLDLVPDHAPVIGVLDDAMVLRTAIALASEKGLGPLSAELTAGLGRLANEADAIRELLGDLHAPFVRYVRELAKKEVRKRFPTAILDDEKTRRQLYGEIDAELGRVDRTPIADLDRAELELRSYFQQKLK
jgi:uncharacterized membrane protein YkvA (DUF1232 family)